MSVAAHVVEAHGARIPAIGLGTWELRGRACARIVEQALKFGYRHVDTAQVYDNEREIGEGLRAPEVDLLLLHWPNAHVPLEETLGALAHAKKLGLTRHIGVSNFTVALIEEAVAVCPEPLVCDQVEYHPYLDQTKVREACARHGIAVVAHSPVAKGRIKTDETLAQIGQAHGKSAAQVCLRWLVQQKVSAIPRTSRIERLSENIEIFDFALSDDEMHLISQMGSAKGRLTDFGFAPKWD